MHTTAWVGKRGNRQPAAFPMGEAISASPASSFSRHAAANRTEAMDLYLFTLVLSFSALLLMAVLGMVHHAPGKVASTHGGHGHGHGPHHGLKLHKAAASARSAGKSDRSATGAMLFAMLSPRTLFSFLLGFGATGLILHPLIPGPWLGLFAVAVLGGWGFETLVMNPFWQFLFGFASTPARTLDTLALDEGRAVTDFDPAGHGLIAVDLDGQTRQVLGTLIPEERGPDVPRVRTGDRLFIRAVNRQRNTCTVSRVGC